VLVYCNNFYNKELNFTYLNSTNFEIKLQLWATLIISVHKWIDQH